MRHTSYRFFFLLLLLLASPAGVHAEKKQKRFVETREDLIRLNGWDEFQNEKKAAEKKRKQGLATYLEDQERLAAKNEKARAQFEIESRKLAILTEAQRRKDEIEHQKELSQRFAAQEKRRLQHLADQERRRRAEGGYVALTEEEEFGLVVDRDRFEWKKRQFFTGPKKPGSSSSSGFDSGFNSSPGRFDNTPGGAFGEVPNDDFFNSLPPLPEGDFFNEIPPPPPPPPMPPGFDGFGEGGPDDFAPPPVFDDTQF